MGTMARTAVVAGTATAVAGSVSRHGAAKAEAQQADAAAQQQAMVDQAAAQAAAQVTAQQAAAAPPPAAAPAAADDSFDRLMKLVELNKSGVLTDEEFAAAKAAMLGT